MVISEKIKRIAEGIGISDEMKEKFVDLVSRLSPENLHRDGEASQSEVRAELSRIKREWKELERQVGRKVTEDEANNWMVSRY